MALPSGTFNSSSSGLLQITFTGVWTETDLASDWTPGGANELWLRGVADDGSDRKTVLLGFQNNSATVEFEYTGGTDVDVSLSVASYNLSGITSVAARKLLIRCYLIKR
jgi:hypothetical protein